MKSVNLMIALIASAAAIDLAFAQLPEGPPAPLPRPAEPVERAPIKGSLTEGKIDRFADAYVKVEDIQRKSAEKMSEVIDSNQVDRIKQDADKRVSTAIREAGLEPAEFDSIAQRMTSDDELKKKIAEKVAQRRGL